MIFGYAAGRDVMFGYLFSVVAGAFGGYLLHAVSMKVNFKIPSK